MSTETKSLHQKLMDRAYDRYGDKTKVEFMEQLDPAEHFAVVMGNFNYQVQNGGFMQWMDNRYADKDTVAALRRYLRQIGTPPALAALELVKTFEEVTKDFDPRHPDDSDWEAVGAGLSDLDKKYYELDEQLMKDAEEFIGKTFVVTN